MALTIDQLDIQISTEATKAVSGIDRLAASLDNLGKKFTFTSKMSTFAKSLEKIAQATSKLDISRITALATSLSTIASVGKIKLTSTINQLKKIPEVAREFETVDMTKFTNSLKTMADALTPLATQLNNIKSGISKLPGEVNKLTSTMDKGAASAKTTSNAFSNFFINLANGDKPFASFTDKLARNISKWRTLTSVVKNVANTFAEWFTTSNDYIETINLFNVSMGEGAKEARKYAERVEALMGIDIAEWMQNQGVFKNLVSGFGVSGEAAIKMSQNLTQLTYDMASFFNATTIEEAFDKLSSAMSGQVKGLREYGIDTTVASLEQYALSKGIDASVRSMSQAEKSMLRYNYIMEKSADLGIWNDMARTIATPANSLRILTGLLTQMKRALGNIVSVLVTQFIPYVQAMVQIITEAADAIAKFFGFDLKNYEADLGEVFADNFVDAEDSLDGVSDSIKEIKKQLMGFDELNIISNPDTDSDSSESGSGSGGVFDMELLEYDFLKNLDTSKLDEIKQKLKDALEYVGVIAAGIAGWSLTKFILGLATANIKVSTLKEAIALLGKNLTITVGVTLSAAGLALEIKGIVDTIKEGLNVENFTEIISGGGLLTLGGAIVGAAFGGIGALIGAAVGATIAGMGMLFAGIWDAVNNGLSVLNEILILGGSTLAGGFIGAFAAGATGPIGALIGFAAGALISIGILIYEKWDEIKAFFEPFTTWFDTTIIQPIKDTLSKASKWVDTNVIKPIIDFFAPIFSAIWDGIVYIYSKIKEIVVGVINAIGAIFSKIGKIFLKIVEIFVALGKSAYTYIINPVIDFVLGFAKIIYNALIKPVISFFVELGKMAYENIIKPMYDNAVWLRDKAISLFKAVGTFAVDFISGALKAVINGVLWGIEATINGFIYMLNGAIDLINKIPGVEITKVAELSIPRLAEGGIVNAGQMFIAREAGPELVGNIGNKTAVANNDQIVAGIEGGVYRAMMAANGNGGKNLTINAIFEMDGEVIGRKVIKYHNGVVMQTGESPLLV